MPPLRTLQGVRIDAEKRMSTGQAPIHLARWAWLATARSTPYRAIAPSPAQTLTATVITAPPDGGRRGGVANQPTPSR